MTKFKKTMLASGMAAALTGASLPSQAIIEGAAGEALLVPFVLFDNQTSINTLVEITVPSAVGVDTVPNFFTAPNSTPTNPLTDSELPDPDLGAPGAYTAGVHVYFFNEESVEVFDKDLPTSPDDFMIINWGDLVAKHKPALNGQKGYMVITTEKGQGQWNNAADFSMFGDAYMVFPLVFGFIDAKIPVLPMSDGVDVLDVPTVQNNVVHNSNGSILAASPLASGMRTNRSDGDLEDYTLFDLTMSNRFMPTLHVIWVDENIGQATNGFVFNDEEEKCSDLLPIDKELNVYWTSPHWQLRYAPRWVDAAIELCYPDGIIDIPDVINSDILYPGFVRFQIDEYIDTGINQPESAAVAFSIQLQVDVINEEKDGVVLVPQILPIETALGHERGQFK